LGDEPRYRIGYTTNTRGGWESDPSTGFREAREVGFRYVEAFATALSDYYPHDAAGLQKKIDEIGVRFVAITGGARGGETAFEDPAKRAAVIANHLGAVRFSRKFGADHQKRTGRFRRHQGNEELGGFGRRKRVRCARVPQKKRTGRFRRHQGNEELGGFGRRKRVRCAQVPQKTNLGRRRPGGTTQEDLKNIAETLNILGKRIFGEEGMRFGPHAHLGSQLQNRNEIDFVLANTDPMHVGFVLDTGHITMAGMDPLALAKQLGHRVVEFHLKDTRPEDAGCTKHVPGPEVDQMKQPYFYPLGNGGVDFPALKAHVDSIRWKGFLVVELGTSPWRPPKESARITADYIRRKLEIPL